MLDVSKTTIHPCGKFVLMKKTPRTQSIVITSTDADKNDYFDFEIIAVGPDVAPPIKVGRWAMPKTGIGLMQYAAQFPDLMLTHADDIAGVLELPAE